MISQTLNQRKSKKSVVTRGPRRGFFMFWYERNKKPDRQLMHIRLNQSFIKAGDALIMIFFELLYSY